MRPVQEWTRGPRTSFDLDKSAGLYALFLRPGRNLPGLQLPDGALIYIGKADGAGGLRTRCHFSGRTVNHSPRKSLAVLLMDHLGLRPHLVVKPNGNNTWGLDHGSDEVLSRWMFENLDVAFEHTDSVRMREKELIFAYAPPLNLTDCAQTERHHYISAARSRVARELETAAGI